MAGLAKSRPTGGGFGLPVLKECKEYGCSDSRMPKEPPVSDIISTIKIKPPLPPSTIK